MLLTLSVLAMHLAVPQDHAVGTDYVLSGAMFSSAMFSPDGDAQVALPWPRDARQMRIEERIIIRIPRHDGRANQESRRQDSRREERQSEKLIENQRPPLPAASFREKPMGRCINMGALIGVRHSGPESMDFLLTGNNRVRAYLAEHCLSREFYSGIYVERARDGLLCINRDALQSRSGSKCLIEKFRQLVPRKK